MEVRQGLSGYSGWYNDDVDMRGRADTKKGRGIVRKKRATGGVLGVRRASVSYVAEVQPKFAFGMRKFKSVDAFVDVYETSLDYKTDPDAPI